MPHELSDVVWSFGVQDVEDVRSVWFSSLGIGIGKVDLQTLVALDDWVDVFDAQLVILGNRDGSELGQRQKLLLLSEDELQEVLVDHAHRWDVQLHYREI